MCFCSAAWRARRLFQEQCMANTADGVLKPNMIRALGALILECSNYFTADVQPVYTSDGLAYAISQYGDDNVILVRDDDYPELELPEWCSSEYLPSGLKKAAVLSGILHAKNLERLGIGRNANPKAYVPKEPYSVYLKATGQSMTFVEAVVTYTCDVIRSKVFATIAMILVCAFLGAIGGALLAGLHEEDARGYMYAGALSGAFCGLISLIVNYIESRRK